MERKYPNNYEEEWKSEVTTPMLSSYAPPEFMGLIRDSRNQYRGRTGRLPKEEEGENA